MNLPDHRIQVLSLARKLLIASRYYPSQTAHTLPRDIILTFQDEKHLDIEKDMELIQLKLQQARNGLNNLTQYIPEEETGNTLHQKQLRIGWFE